MNAIILAAGLGSRLKEITVNTHKSLLNIAGRVNLERTIECLKELGIEEINIVVGYKASDFEYLKEKFGVNLIYNDKFQVLNNLYSFCLTLEFFGDSFVIDADVVMLKNVLQITQTSVYYTTVREVNNKNDWVVTCNKSGRITKIVPSSKNLPTLFGISYFTKNDARLIKEYIKTLPQSAYHNKKLYYDNVFVSMLDKIVIKEVRVDNKFVCEIDDKDDLTEIDKKGEIYERNLFL
ncbi:NTP transferase domain-containing protein [Campylobacter sp. 9BO]|uniref:NTP transferase domain-containing protein n=1 Tax=Campylobacter sp. 9BO TaxID=3424759 RepID=UPI003D328DBE